MVSSSLEINTKNERPSAIINDDTKIGAANNNETSKKEDLKIAKSQLEKLLKSISSSKSKSKSKLNRKDFSSKSKSKSTEKDAKDEKKKKKKKVKKSR